MAVKLSEHDLARRRYAKERREKAREEKYVVLRAKPRDKSGRSPALTFVGMVWDMAQAETGHSWQRFNSALYSALRQAIEAGMIFHEDDFAFMAANWRVGYWLGMTPALGDSIYATAVKFRNIQACRAMEKWYGREPFIIGGERLAVGSDFPLGLRAKVTSFTGDQKQVNVCWYELIENGDVWKEKIKERGKFTAEQVRAISRTIEQSKKDAAKIFCIFCGEERAGEGKCKCGSIWGVRNGTTGRLEKSA